MDKTLEKKIENWASTFPPKKNMPKQVKPKAKKRPSTAAERMRKWRLLHQNKYRELKIEVLTHYGNGKLSCVRCGFDNDYALTIDHVNGGGRKEKRETKMSSQSLYAWLKKNSYPKGYQTLCMNCQFIKRFMNNENYPPTYPVTKSKYKCQLNGEWKQYREPILS